MEQGVKIKCRGCNLNFPLTDVRKHPTEENRWLCPMCYHKLTKIAPEN